MKPLLDLKCGLQGFATWEVRKESTGELVRDSGGPQENLVVSSGIDMFMTGTSMQNIDTCRVGLGTAAPSSEQTDLVSRFGGFAAASVITETNSGGAPWWLGSSRTFTFGANTVAGQPLAEFGFFGGSGNGAGMFSRLLFRDGLGDPTTITLQSDEFLIITYEVRLYLPVADATGTFELLDGVGGSQTINYAIRPVNILSSTWEAFQMTVGSSLFVGASQTLSPITDNPSGVSYVFDSVSMQSYTPGSGFRNVSFFLDPSEGNVSGGIGIITFGPTGNIATSNKWQISFDPKLPKDSSKSLNFSGFFRISLAAGTP